MTDKLKAVVEAVGECWHEFNNAYNVNKDEHFICPECEAILELSGNNPSPTDLNELFRLAEKLGYKNVDFFFHQNYRCCIYPQGTAAGYSLISTHSAYGDTSAEALLNALYESIKGR
jgi:hypothetical protein